ncbi:MAG TPA: ATP-binding protein [Paraburkholderia sp.]
MAMERMRKVRLLGVSSVQKVGKMRENNVGTYAAADCAVTNGADGLAGYAETRGEMHDLEAHIDELKAIDIVRQNSVVLREKGNKALEKLIKDDTSIEPPSSYEQAKAVRVALQVARAFDEPHDSLKKLTWVENLTRISQQKRSVLVAAESMRALVATNEHTLSKRVMRCWYWIVRELFTASEPDWAIGGAKAGSNGRVTGYTTAHCVYAVMDLSESLTQTGEVCRYLSKVSKALTAIAKENVPVQWAAIERERMAASCRNTLRRRVPALAFTLLPFADVTGENIAEYVDVQLKTHVSALLAQAVKDFDALLDEIKKFRDRERETVEEKTRAESSMGHSIALSAIEKGRACAANAAEALALPDDHWSKAAEEFKLAGAKVRDGLAATRKFLSTVIDEQLAASALVDDSRWEPAELAFAANAYVMLTKHEPVPDEERLQRAACLVQASLGADGTVTVRRSYHVEGATGYRAVNSAVVAAAADLLRAVKLPLDGKYVPRWLAALMKRSIVTDESIVGWPIGFLTSRTTPDMLETASAVEALAAVNRLLDDGINRIILDHFTVRLPSTGGLELDDLFYPDYGLAHEAPKTEAVSSLVRPSCAITFQRLQAHVTSTKNAPLHSLVLHGPAGTGKTTLVEALAQSCGVPMVEVTPSDLAKRGEAELERRARTVFEALSLLTHVVILFDEFDPILRRRDTTGERQFTYFSFLTPGMLPKLKNLSEKARKRSVAYVLITNLLGTLDEAAVRKGRFDEKVAVFSPDPLSRLGRLTMVTNALAAKNIKGFSTIDEERLREAVFKTGGLGMPALTEKGWYVGNDDPKLECPISYVFGHGDTMFRVAPEPEEPFDGKLRGEGKAAEREFDQWLWLSEWDQAVAGLPTGKARDLLRARPKKLKTSGQEKAAAEKEAKDRASAKA